MDRFVAAMLRDGSQSAAARMDPEQAMSMVIAFVGHEAERLGRVLDALRLYNLADVRVS